MNPVSRLLKKNMSPGRIVGFVISNFLGLAIIMGALQFWTDAKSLWTSDDSFVKSDFLVVNKKVSASNMWGESDSGFTEDELKDLKSQPWVRKIGVFTPADYRVWASVKSGGRGMSTMMFFESVPDDFVDVADRDWNFRPDDKSVPVIIPKDYLTLYNFGFAGSAGLPQMTETVMSGIPLELDLVSEDGTRREVMRGHIAGYSNRINTILVPESFMEWSNEILGNRTRNASPSRVIINVSSPGDVAITKYLEQHEIEVAGDKSSSSSSFLLRLVVGIVVAVGGIITLLSLLILLLSVSLLMEKNRRTIHQLLFLGYPVGKVAVPYVRIIVIASLSAWILATVSCEILRHYYSTPLEGLGAGNGGLLLAPLAGMIVTAVVCGFNILAVMRRVKMAWRLKSGF